MDWPDWILKAAVRHMPVERSDWGTAMLAELAHIQDPHARWQFAWGCVRVALFPPPPAGVFMNTPMKHWLTTFGLAALFSLMFLSAFMLLASSTRLDIQSEAGWVVFLDFFRNWLILTLIFTPIVHGLREGEARWRPLLITLGGAVLFGGLLVAPFALMEYWNNPRIQSGEFAFPFLLFFALWLSPTLFFLGATPIVRGLRAGQPIWARPMTLLLRIAFLVFLALTWVSAILNEMPCFLGGVPGCD